MSGFGWCPCCDGRGFLFCTVCEWRSDEDDNVRGPGDK